MPLYKKVLKMKEAAEAASLSTTDLDVQNISAFQIRS